MKNIKIAHEAPISVFEDVQKKTDYDYCLCHLYVTDVEYRAKFLAAKAAGRFIILDTSVFELGEAFEEKQYIKVIHELLPNVYIVPDVLESRESTLDNATRWSRKIIPTLPSGCAPMGVVQGRDLRELISCYNYLTGDLRFKHIAISFDYSFYEEEVGHPDKLISWMLGRVKLLSRMWKMGYIQEDVHHHLLGVALPQEGLFYNHKDFNWISSIDTSNPVMHAIKNTWYECAGMWTKPTTKLFTLIDRDREDIDVNILNYNLEAFKHFWK